MQMRQGLQTVVTVMIVTLKYVKKKICNYVKKKKLKNWISQINVIVFCFWYHR